MSNLKLVETQKTRVHADVVEKLERALEEARAGRLTGVAIAGCTTDDAAWTVHSSSLNRAVVLGALSVVQHDMLRKMFDE